MSSISESLVPSARSSSMSLPAEAFERVMDRFSLGIENPVLERDEDARFHGSINLKIQFHGP